ncbi:hypothetical protein LK462_33445 (plasmid) [Burkholderia vietnamiensis]|nr:hypothetical protein LK462_33445 [Burkholderia vietnamiensis]
MDPYAHSIRAWFGESMTMGQHPTQACQFFGHARVLAIEAERKHLGAAQKFHFDPEK